MRESVESPFGEECAFPVDYEVCRYFKFMNQYSVARNMGMIEPGRPPVVVLCPQMSAASRMYRVVKALAALCPASRCCSVTESDGVPSAD